MRTPVRTVTDDHGTELTVRRCRECGAWKPARALDDVTQEEQ